MKEESLLKFSFKILFIFLIFCFAIGFYSFGFTYDVVCPKCDGTGQVWERRYDFNVKTWVTGYWPCPTCGGNGEIYLYSSATYALAFFFSFVACFLLFFALDYGVTALRLNQNPWVKDVKEMHYWLNPMYCVWLFHVNRKKWVKWTTMLSLVATIMVITTIAMALTAYQLTLTPVLGQSIFTGWLFGTVLTIPFAVAWYKNYESLSKFA